MSEMLLEVLALDLEVVRTIRKIALIGIFSNDLLTERLVFKGGSALELMRNACEFGYINPSGECAISPIG